MRRRPTHVLLALALMALGMLAARSGYAQMPPPPPGSHSNLPSDNSPGQMATIPRSTAFFIASVEIAVIVAAIVVGIVLPMRPAVPAPLGQPVVPDERKRPEL